MSKQAIATSSYHSSEYLNLSLSTKADRTKEESGLSKEDIFEVFFKIIEV